MQNDVEVDVTPPPSGGLIRLQAHASDLGSWLGPTWATLCGVVASNAFRWQSEDWLPLALLPLLVDAGWGTLWTALARTDWALALREWRTWKRVGSTAKLPYTLPGTPADRISRWIGRVSTWWRDAFWGSCGSAVRAMLIALPLTVLVSALLGPELLLLSVASLALMQLGVIWTGGRGVVPSGWDGLIAVALPWLAGHTVFGSVTVASASLAMLFALAWGSAWRAASGGGRAVLVAGHLVSATILILLGGPLAASTLLLLLVPQMALLPWTRRDLPIHRFVRYTRPWLMAAMAVAALAL
jgi:hypothetical protein